MEQNRNKISDIINELKRLQVEHGDISSVVIVDSDPLPAWPSFNEKENRVEF